MNGQDRKEIEELKLEVKSCSINIDEVSKTVKDIKENHLPHLEDKVNKALFRSMVNIFAQIAILLGILACMATIISNT